MTSGVAPTNPADEHTLRVRLAAAHLGLQIEVRARRDAKSLADAARVLDVPPSHIVKTLVVARRSRRTPEDSDPGGRFLFALIPGDRALSWPKLREVVGVNRLRLPDAEEALAATGYERGTIVPLGSETAWPVYADERILGRRIAMGAGARGYSLIVDADALVAALGADVADISQAITAAPPS